MELGETILKKLYKKLDLYGASINMRQAQLDNGEGEEEEEEEEEEEDEDEDEDEEEDEDEGEDVEVDTPDEDDEEEGEKHAEMERNVAGYCQQVARARQAERDSFGRADDCDSKRRTRRAECLTEALITAEQARETNEVVARRHRIGMLYTDSQKAACALRATLVALEICYKRFTRHSTCQTMMTTGKNLRRALIHLYIGTLLRQRKG